MGDKGGKKDHDKKVKQEAAKKLAIAKAKADKHLPEPPAQ